MDENRNDAADRAIAKIHEKLQGYEDGTSGEHKTIAGQVKLLINEARDHDNLCVMFSGWAPWV
jgi:ataxia telangiectasia mutated family protein